MSSIFKKIFFFFFLFIFPLLLYHVLGGVVKYFLKNFLKKFSDFFLTFVFECGIIIIENEKGIDNLKVKGVGTSVPPKSPHIYYTTRSCKSQVFFRKKIKKIKQKLLTLTEKFDIIYIEKMRKERN